MGWASIQPLQPVKMEDRRMWARSSVVEHRTFNPLVVGSNPTEPTIFLSSTR